MYLYRMTGPPARECLHRNREYNIASNTECARTRTKTRKTKTERKNANTRTPRIVSMCTHVCTHMCARTCLRASGAGHCERARGASKADSLIG